MNPSFPPALTFSAILAFAGIASAPAQNLVVNGDFNSAGDLVFTGGSTELYVTPADEPYDFGTGWIAQRSGVSFNRSGTRGISTADGSDFLILESVLESNTYGGAVRSDGTISQFVPLQAGVTYTVSFDARLVDTTVDLDVIYTYLYIGTTNTDGTPRSYPLKDAGHAYGSTSGVRDLFEGVGTWAHRAYTFTAPVDGDYRLTIGLRVQGSSYRLENTVVMALDNLSITEVSAVPEPSVFAALAGLGALGAAALRRRHRAA